MIGRRNIHIDASDRRVRADENRFLFYLLYCVLGELRIKN